MFWCDTQSRLDYQSFGDVVVFDSTYRMNSCTHGLARID
ncbi:hypothetical protein ACP4OV_017789 [Aristida adscensionis]